MTKGRQATFAESGFEAFRNSQDWKLFGHSLIENQNKSENSARRSHGIPGAI